MANYDYQSLSQVDAAQNDDRYYRDPTSLPDLPDDIKNGQQDGLSIQIATWIRQKMYGIDVREALARAVEYFTVLFYRFKTDATKISSRQDAVEKRQSDLERRMSQVIQDATDDAEVITARDSERFGSFNLLDDRLENIEEIIARYVPEGFTIQIQYELARNPLIVVKRYDYAIGTESEGLGTGPDGSFGGTAVEVIPTNINYESGVAIIKMPSNYKQGGEFIVISPTEVLLIDGSATLKFEVEDGATGGKIID